MLHVDFSGGVNICFFMPRRTGTSTVCTPEQYKDCADPALGKPHHFATPNLH